MAHGFTDFVHNEFLDWVLRAESPSLGATLYFAAYRSGSEVSTGVWTDYARVAVTRNTTNFDVAAAGDSANTLEVDFSAAAAVTGGPAEVDEVRVYDAAVAGNLVWQGPLPSVKSINDGDPVKIPVGGADFSIAQTP